MTFLTHLAQQPSDPILGMSAQFQADDRPQKTNLTVGVFCNAHGLTPTFRSVREAENKLYKQNLPKTYLPILGTPQYREALARLVFDELSEKITTIYTPGGTGGIRMAAALLGKNNADTAVWVSNPTWGNHLGILSGCGLNYDTYPYTHQNGVLDIEPIIKSLSNAKTGDVVLLHGCCHNPTGVDPNTEQWEQLFNHLEARELIPLFDVAYHGFAISQAQDIQPIQTAAKRFKNIMVVYSFSKVMGLYAERVGGLLVQSNSADGAKIVESNLANLARTNYSNPSMHGLKVAQMVLTDTVLKQNWQTQLAEFRAHLKATRFEFSKKLQANNIPTGGLENQHGLFSFLPINAKQAKQLRDEYAIYLLDSGRINIAGLNPMNLNYVVSAIAEVLV